MYLVFWMMDLCKLHFSYLANCVPQIFQTVFLISCKLYFSDFTYCTNCISQNCKVHFSYLANCISQILQTVFLSYCERPSTGWLPEELSSSQQPVAAFSGRLSWAFLLTEAALALLQGKLDLSDSKSAWLRSCKGVFFRYFCMVCISPCLRRRGVVCTWLLVDTVY